MSRLGIKPTALVCSIFCLLMTTNIDAQISERIKQRIKENTTQKIEDKIVKKADDKTDQALDSLFKEKESTPQTPTEGTSSEKSTESANPGFNFGGMANATYESSYTFEQEVKVEIKTKENGKKDKVEVANMDMLYGENCYMNILRDEDEKAAPKSLMDLKNNTTIMLNDEDMTAMAISMNFMTDKLEEMAEEQSDSSYVDPNYTITKTGRTKMIAGYSCEEYIIETEDMTMNTWYTDDVSVSIHKNMGNYAMFGSFSKSASTMPQGEAVGMMMESHMVEKTGDQGTVDYLVKEIIVKTTTLNMSDYTFTRMGGR